MKDAFIKLQKYFLFFILSLSFINAFSKAEDGTYTINFKNVSITEYVSFVSKICNVNFLYEEGDLNFNVTVVSEDDIEPNNVMATLIQILRIHGLTILEEDTNLVIHKNPDVKQLAKIITDGSSLDNAPPIITRVFRVRNAKIDNIASIIKPMISTEAILEISVDTRQLIITDVLSNVKKIGDLIEVIDSPINPLEIEIYTTKENTPKYLMDLTNQIMAPIAEGAPFILVPQESSGSLFIISTPRLIDKAISVLGSLDTAPKPGAKHHFEPGDIFVYKPQYLTRGEIQNTLKQIIDSLEATGYAEPVLTSIISSAKWIPDTNSFLFTGTAEGIIKIKELLQTIDIQSSADVEAQKMSFFTYKPENRKLDDVAESVTELANNLKDSKIADIKLIETLENVKVIPSTQSLLFTGDTDTFLKIKDLLASIDLPEPKPLKSLGKVTFFIYKIQNAPVDRMLSAMQNTSDNLKKAKIQETPLIEALDSAKYIAETNSLLFTGDANSLKQIQELIPSFDVDMSQHKILPLNSQFFVYKPVSKNIDELAESLLEISKNLEAGKLVNPSFMTTIGSMKIAEASNSLTFTGDADSIARIDSLLKTIDTPIDGTFSQQNISIYQVKHASKEQIEKFLQEVSANLDLNNLANKKLKASIDSAKWIAETNSFLFHGSDVTLSKINDILEKFDTKEEVSRLKDSYHLYKLQNTTGNIIVEDLDAFAEKLKKQNVQKPHLINMLENVKWVKETNSILLTGNAKDIEEGIQIIKDFDTARTTQEVTAHSSYFLYKPKFATAQFIENSLRDTASNLEKAMLADPNLINAINSIRLIESTGSLAFTGTKDAIDKIKIMIAEIDIPGAGKIRTLGKTTYLVYKIEKATPQRLINAITTFASDLEKSGASDKEFILAMQSVKYKPEIVSLLFTGTAEALEKVQQLIVKLDSDELSEPQAPPSAYFVYKPKNVTGEVLLDTLHNFATHLKLTGFENKSLYDTLQNLKWDPPTKSLLFSGDEHTIEEVKNLLATFDVPGEGGEKDIIQPIDDTSFLVYKLQYHKGDSIQSALKQISNELASSGTNVKKNLLSAINSIQWIQVTNSLLGSGDRETMSRLKELIGSLDVPLKQVFIEMLVIETSFTNLLNFGLNWGGKYKHKDKFVAGVTNSPYTSSSGTLSDFSKNLAGLNETTKVTGNTFPFSQGFDLGIIGDIILHKGKSFLSLGSLMEAVQQDEESSIIMTPKILAQDSKPSNLFIGQNVPYVGSQTTYNQTTQATTTNLEYRDIGMDVTITPVLGNSDTVSMDINMSRTAEVPGQTSSTNTTGVQGILTNKTTMTTTVHIPDKCFLVLSGMGNDSKAKVKTGIPCLGGLPLIGAAFSQNENLKDKKNIVIFIRPHIINSYKDMEAVTENAEDFFRDNSGAAGLEADFDESVDFLKPYEDE